MAGFGLTTGRWELIVVFWGYSAWRRFCSGLKVCRQSGTDLGANSPSVAEPLT